MIPSTISCVASSRPRWPCSARSDASIVYATEETVHDLHDRRHQPGLAERVELPTRFPRVDNLDVVALDEAAVYGAHGPRPPARGLADGGDWGQAGRAGAG